MEVKNKSFIFNKKQIPNILTIIRMCCFPIIVILLVLNSYFTIPLYQLNNPLVNQKDPVVYSTIGLYHFIAGVIFVFACLTDFVDGVMARKWHCESVFGKLWDPIADKLIVNSVTVIFAWQGLIPVYLPIIMIARDIIVDAYKMYAASQNVVVAANYFGKAKTFTQMMAIILVFFIFCRNDNGLDDKNFFVYWAIQNLLFYLATLISVVSLVIYIIEIKKKIAVKK